MCHQQVFVQTKFTVVVPALPSCALSHSQTDSWLVPQEERRILAVQALQKCLSSGTDGLARRFFKRSAKPIGVAWQLATGGDLALPLVPGPTPLPVRVLNRYVDRVQAAAESDPEVTTTFLRVTSLLDPPSRLLAPATLARVVRATWRRHPSPTTTGRPALVQVSREVSRRAAGPR